MDMNLSTLQEIVEDTGARCTAVHGVRHSLGTTMTKRTIQSDNSQGSQNINFSNVKCGRSQNYEDQKIYTPPIITHTYRFLQNCN